MKVILASNAHTWIRTARDDALFMWKHDSMNPTQCGNFNPDISVNVHGSKPLKHRENPVDQHYAEKESEKILKTNWCILLTLHNEHSIYLSKFISNLTLF